MSNLAARCLEDLPVAAWLLDHDGQTVRLCNAQARHCLGMPVVHPHAATDPLRLDDLLSPMDREGLAAALQACLALPPQDATWCRLVEGRPRVWTLRAVRHEEGWLVTALELGAVAPHQPGGISASAPPVAWMREVHHRLRNHLQGLAGLLSRAASEQPAARATLEHAVIQLRVLGAVQDLQGRMGSQVPVTELLRAVSAILPVPLQWDLSDAGSVPVREGPAESGAADDHPQSASARQLLWAHLPNDPNQDEARISPTWGLGEEDAATLALCLGELLLEAAAASSGQPACCSAAQDGRGVWVEIGSEGPWTQGVEAGQVETATRGLGLVKALLPRRGASLSMVSQGPKVCARLHIGPPCVWPQGQSAPQSAW